MNPSTLDELSSTPKPSIHMSFWDHLSDFRKLLIQCLSALLLGCILSIFSFAYLADFMNKPLQIASKSNPELLQGLVTQSPMGVFSVLFQISLLGGTALSLPFMLFFIARFISPALSIQEKKVFIPLLVSAFLFFVIGACFSYFFVIPASLIFSMQLNHTFGFQLIWSATHYYSLVTWMTIGIGLCFEFPLAVLALVASGLVASKKLIQVRRYVLMGILVIGAAIIPGGDPISLILLALPLYLSYEIVIWIGQKLENKKQYAKNL